MFDALFLKAIEGAWMMGETEWMSLREVTDWLSEATGADWKWKDVVRALHKQNPESVHVIVPPNTALIENESGEIQEHPSQYVTLLEVSPVQDFLKQILLGDNLENALAYSPKLFLRLPGGSAHYRAPATLPATAIRVNQHTANYLAHPSAFKELVGQMRKWPREYPELRQAMTESQTFFDEHVTRNDQPLLNTEPSRERQTDEMSPASPAETAPPAPEFTEPRITALAAGEVSQKEFTKGIGKQQVITAFAGLHFDEARWSKSLASPPKWLVACRIQRGTKSVNKHPTIWDPVQIAIALTDKGRDVPIKKLDAVFVANLFLKPWVKTWTEKSAFFR